MIARLRQLLDVGRSLFAVPHLIAEQAVLELRVDELEQRHDHLAAITGELYIGDALIADPAGSSRNGTHASGETP